MALGSQIFAAGSKDSPNAAQEPVTTPNSQSWSEGLMKLYRSGEQGMRVAMYGAKHNTPLFEELLQEKTNLKARGTLNDMTIDATCLSGPKVLFSSSHCCCLFFSNLLSATCALEAFVCFIHLTLSSNLIAPRMSALENSAKRLSSTPIDLFTPLPSSTCSIDNKLPCAGVWMCHKDICSTCYTLRTLPVNSFVVLNAIRSCHFLLHTFSWNGPVFFSGVSNLRVCSQHRRRRKS